MPTPTREQFEAAQRRVIANAPAGLSRDQFFELINRELSIPDPTQFEVGGPSDNVLHPKPILGQKVADALTKPLVNVPVVGPLTSPASLALIAGGALSSIKPSANGLRTAGDLAGDVNLLKPGLLVKRGLNAVADKMDSGGSPNATWRQKPAPEPPAAPKPPLQLEAGQPPAAPQGPLSPQDAELIQHLIGPGTPPKPPVITPPPADPSFVHGVDASGDVQVPSSLGEGAPVSPSTENVSGASATPDIAPAQAAGIRPPQQPINDLVPPSRSSAGAGRDGLTEADRAAAGINPAMTITKVPETTAEMINRARGARRQNYKTAAEEESVRQSSMARDPQEPVDVSGEQLQELLRQMRGEP